MKLNGLFRILETDKHSTVVILIIVIKVVVVLPVLSVCCVVYHTDNVRIS